MPEPVRMTRAPIVVVLASLLLLAACSGTAEPEAPVRADAAAADDAGEQDIEADDGTSPGEPYDIVLSLNQIGIPQRAQGVNGAEHVADHTFADQVDFEVRVSGDSVSDQVASLQQIIREEPDAIIVVASSVSALNQVLDQACAADIVVVNILQVAEDVDCTYKRPLPNVEGGSDVARFICEQLDGSGTILADQAIAGIPSATAEHEAMLDTLAQECPDVTVAATYQSMYSPGPELTAVSAALAVNPDIDGVVSFAYCSSIATALERAGLDPVPMSCGGVNENALVCAELQIACLLRNNPSVAYPLALETTVAILDGEDVARRAPAFDGNFIMNADVGFDPMSPLSAPTLGVDYFADAAPELVIPVTASNFDITPEIAMGG